MRRTGSDMSKLDSLSSKLEKISRHQNELSQTAESERKMNPALEIFTSTYRRITGSMCALFFITLLGSYGFLLNPAGIGFQIL